MNRVRTINEGRYRKWDKSYRRPFAPRSIILTMNHIAIPQLPVEANKPRKLVNQKWKNVVPFCFIRQTLFHDSYQDYRSWGVDRFYAKMTNRWSRLSHVEKQWSTIIGEVPLCLTKRHMKFSINVCMYDVSLTRSGGGNDKGAILIGEAGVN